MSESVRFPASSPFPITLTITAAAATISESGSVTLQGTVNPQLLGQISVAERVQELRKEIADIRKHSSYFLRTGRKDRFGPGAQERRVQRLKKIKNELASLTAWKKL